MFHYSILGATGYVGAELVRLLLQHPQRGKLSLGSENNKGQGLSTFYPNLLHSFTYPEEEYLLSQEDAIINSDVVFVALPSGYAEDIAQICQSNKALCIDLSADFRFGADEAAYLAHYGLRYKRPNLHAQAVYGLPELHRDAISKATIIANPGCYPTCVALGLYPILHGGLTHKDYERPVIIDAKSGYSGAGRELKRETHYSESTDSITAYKIDNHRHAPEIERVLTNMAKHPVKVIFTPHLAPMNRGMLCTMYIELALPMSAEELQNIYATFYAKEYFIKVGATGNVASSKQVRNSNFCYITTHVAKGGRTAIIVSCIDNLGKGAAGQAVQNMNIALGLDERAGLHQLPPSV